MMFRSKCELLYYYTYDPLTHTTITTPMYYSQIDLNIWKWIYKQYLVW